MSTKRGVYDEQAVQTFYLSSAEAETIEQLLTKVVATQQTGVRPTFAANKAGNSITVRATLPMLQMVERLIVMNDKPRAEISVDVEILEVNRGNAKQYGLDLSSYQIGLAFSPETRPDTDTTSSVFNLNTISAGVSTADFYAAVPSAVIRFLEQDSETKVIAKPNLRGAEGEKLSLKLGEELPVPSTTFYNPYGSGNIATTPLTSFTYKNVGVNLDLEPRVDLRRRHHPEGRPRDQREGTRPERGRTEPPSFFSRKVETRIRSAGRESNLLAGLLRENERKTLKGVPGISHIPNPERSVCVDRQGNRPDRHRDAAHASHRAHTRADAEGLLAGVRRHAGQPRDGRPPAAHPAVGWPARPAGPRRRSTARSGRPRRRALWCAGGRDPATRAAWPGRRRARPCSRRRRRPCRP